MKKSTIILVICLFTIPCFAQTRYQLKQLEEIFESWTIDDHENVTFTRIIEDLDLPKDEIYLRALGFFAYNNQKTNSVITLENYEKGLLLTEGYFEYFTSYCVFLDNSYFSAPHILRVDFKENRVRLLLSVNTYKIHDTTLFSDREHHWTRKIVNEFPIHGKGSNRKMYAKAFIELYQKSQRTFDAFEDALRNGNTSPDLESDDW